MGEERFIGGQSHAVPPTRVATKTDSRLLKNRPFWDPFARAIYPCNLQETAIFKRVKLVPKNSVLTTCLTTNLNGNPAAPRVVAPSGSDDGQAVVSGVPRLASVASPRIISGAY